MTPAEIRERAITAAVRGIEQYAAWSETLGLGTVTVEDEVAIRADMRVIASKIQRGSVCDLSI